MVYNGMKRREMVTMIILWFVTCGIYPIYWFMTFTDELNAGLQRNDRSGLASVLLMIVTCGIYGIFWIFKTSAKVRDLEGEHGIRSSDDGILLFVLWFFTAGIFPAIILQGKLNNVIDNAN